MKTLIECSTCVYSLLPEEREGLVEINGKMCKPRKPLTDEEILTYRHMIDWTAEWSYINFARAIEAAHNIKEGT